MQQEQFNKILERLKEKNGVTTNSAVNVPTSFVGPKTTIKLNTALDKLRALAAKHAVEEVDTTKLTGLSTEQEQKLPPAELEEIVGEAVKDILTPTVAVAVAATASEPEPELEEKTKLVTNTEIGVARDITLNAKQQDAYNKIVIEGKSICLIGSAGTGKTTSMNKITAGLLSSSHIPTLQVSTKFLQANTPGIVVLSYTNKAVNNIRHAVVERLKTNTLTMHKLLEFEPVFYETEVDGKIVNKMAFEPQRNKLNPLPYEIQLVVFEESSMISTELYQMLQDAMPHKHQEVFLGDIQQLPPVFGAAILGFKMLELPVIELTEIYRQAANSPIINLAWALLEGDQKAFLPKTKREMQLHPVTGQNVNRLVCPGLEIFNKKTENGSVYIQPWQKSLDPEVACNTMVMQLKQWWTKDYYNPDKDVILCPFNKAFGTIELNKGISQFLGTARKAMVHEVIAGFNKHYLAEGDRVLYGKEDAFIVRIARNGTYMGVTPQPASTQLDRWGHTREETDADFDSKTEEYDEEDENFENMMIGGDEEDRVNSASHIIEVEMAYERGKVFTIAGASDVNNLLGGYAITVHKFQGSEADKVFFIMHESHGVMNSRELLYTAVTRAKKELHIVCEPHTLMRGVNSQRIKGNTLEEKAKWFMGKLKEKEANNGKNNINANLTFD